MDTKYVGMSFVLFFILTVSACNIVGEISNLTHEVIILRQAVCKHFDDYSCK